MGDDPFKQMRDSLAQLRGDALKELAEFGKPRLPDVGKLAQIQMPDPLDYFHGARKFIDALIDSVNKWRGSDPKHADVVISLVMTDGRYMFVSDLQPVGFHGYLARGFVDGSPCMVSGHINGLTLIGVVIEKQAEVGYRARARKTKDVKAP